MFYDQIPRLFLFCQIQYELFVCSKIEFNVKGCNYYEQNLSPTVKNVK